MAKKQQVSTPEEAKPEESISDKETTEKTEEKPRIGTTEALFSDFLETPAQEQESGKEKAKPEVAESEDKEAPKAAEISVPESIDLDSFGDSMVRTKVNGVETDVKLKDLVKGYQTDSYLTQKGQKLASDRKALESRIEALEKRPAQEQEAEEISEEDAWVLGKIKPELDKRDEIIANLQKELSGLQESTRDAAYESMLVRADKTIKGKKSREDGSPVFDDFRSYVPKIENFISSLPEDQQSFMLNDMGYISVYNEMKMSDLVTGKAEVEKKPAETRQKPKLKKIPVVESGTGTPTGANDEDASYRKAFDKASKSGTTEDWMKVLDGAFGS